MEPAHRPRRRRRRLRARRAARGAAAPARGAGPLRRRGVRTAGESAPGPRTPVLPGTLRLREGQGGRRRAGSGGGGSPAAPLRASPGELPGLPSPATPPVRSAAGAGAGPGGTPGIPGCSGRTAAPGALTAPTRAAPTPPLPSPGSPRLGRSCPRCRAWRGVPRQEPPDPPRGVLESRIPPAGVPHRPPPADRAPPSRITDPGSFGSVSAVPSPGLNPRLTSGSPGGTVPRPCVWSWRCRCPPAALSSAPCAGPPAVGFSGSAPCGRDLGASWCSCTELRHRAAGRESCVRAPSQPWQPPTTAPTAPGMALRGTPAPKSRFHRWGEGRGTTAPRAACAGQHCAGLSQ